VNTLGVGIVCFSTFGGSGVVACEVAASLARRGHRVHVFSDERPARLAAELNTVAFHRVRPGVFAQLRHDAYALALASRIAEVARRERLDVVHAHYAVPHAASAYLACRMLGDAAPALVTTLHGTDITLVGSDPTFLPLTRFSIEASDAVTTPSAWLAEATYRTLEVSRTVPIDVVPNFVDTARFSPAPAGGAASAGGARARRGGPRVIVHVSNFRPLKRVGDVVRVFAEVLARRARAGAGAGAAGDGVVLRLAGAGPDRAAAETLAVELGVAGAVQFLGEPPDLPDVLRAADVFLLPSETESFGLAALEALACGVPVVASAVGGLPEVVPHDEVGLLAPVGDVATMATHVARLLDDEALHARLAAAARVRAVTVYPIEPAVSRYESLYRRARENARAPHRRR